MRNKNEFRRLLERLYEYSIQLSSTLAKIDTDIFWFYFLQNQNTPKEWQEIINRLADANLKFNREVGKYENKLALHNTNEDKT